MITHSFGKKKKKHTLLSFKEVLWVNPGSLVYIINKPKEKWGTGHLYSTTMKLEKHLELPTPPSEKDSKTTSRRNHIFRWLPSYWKHRLCCVKAICFYLKKMVKISWVPDSDHKEFYLHFHPMSFSNTGKAFNWAAAFT